MRLHELMVVRGLHLRPELEPANQLGFYQYKGINHPQTLRFAGDVEVTLLDEPGQMIAMFPAVGGPMQRLEVWTDARFATPGEVKVAFDRHDGLQMRLQEAAGAVLMEARLQAYPRAIYDAALAVDVACTQNPISGQYGSLIRGTFQTRDLIPAFIEEFRRLDDVKFLGWLSRIVPGAFDRASVLCLLDNGLPWPPENLDGWWDSAEAQEMRADLEYQLNQLAPAGMRFGAHEGNDSDFGWWPLLTEPATPEGVAVDVVPCISLDHLPQHLFEEMVTKGRKFPWCTAVTWGHGVWLWLGGEATLDAQAPRELLTLRAWLLEAFPNSSWLRLDNDGEAVDGLQRYE